MSTHTTPACEVCRNRPGWLRVEVNRTATGPGIADVCGPCGLILQVEGRGTLLNTAT